MTENDFYEHLDSSIVFIKQASEIIDSMKETVGGDPERAAALSNVVIKDLKDISEALSKTDDMLRMTFVLFGFSIDAPKVREYQKANAEIAKKISEVGNEIIKLAQSIDPKAQEEKQKSFDEEKNIAPLEIKEEQFPSKEKLEDDILDLHMRKQKAVSKQEQDDIQKQIDRLYKILHSSLKSKIRR